METTQLAVKTTRGSDGMKKSKTMAEREAEYERARARIFSQVMNTICTEAIWTGKKKTMLCVAHICRRTKPPVI